jgi:hypothetical protein
MEKSKKEAHENATEDMKNSIEWWSKNNLSMDSWNAYDASFEKFSEALAKTVAFNEDYYD